jgi:hypothetical protein
MELNDNVSGLIFSDKAAFAYLKHLVVKFKLADLC